MSREMAQSKKCLPCKNKDWPLAPMSSRSTGECETLEHTVLHGMSPSKPSAHSLGNPVEEKVGREDWHESIRIEDTKPFCTR